MYSPLLPLSTPPIPLHTNKQLIKVKYAAVHWEEQAYANTTGPGFFLHSEIVAPYLVHYGTKEQKEMYLPRLCSGIK